MSDEPRKWMTAEEFLTEVETYRQARLAKPLKARKPFVPGPFVRTYVLDWSRMFTPKRPKLITPEDVP
jgi:hypothetical protein